MKFKCGKCGECCRNLDQDDLYEHMHSGNGVCYNLDEKGLCAIYNHRPDICNIDLAYEKYFADICSKEEYHDINYEGCRALMSKSKDKDVKEKLNSTVIGVTQKEITQRHGEAASQMLQALKGKRYDANGVEIMHKGRSLEQISQYKINKDREYSNLKQQAGFSAELIKEARDNKSAILQGDNTRTRTTDGIGSTNDQKYDFVKVDENNQPIAGSESQMKFKGRYSTLDEIRWSSEKLVDDMVSDKWQKYSDRPMDIPSEQVELAKEYANKRVQELKVAAEKYRSKGEVEKARLLDSKAARYEKAQANIRDSGLTNREALEARTNLKGFVAKEVIKDSHTAGLESAKGALIFGGAISSAQNLYAVLYEDKNLDEAVKDVMVDTGKNAGTAYLVGFGGTGVKSLLHSSGNSALRTVGNTNAPAMFATGIIEVGKSLNRYAKGEIDEEELLQELGEKGTGMVAASYGASIGSIILPGLGTLVGGMIGYTVSSLLYKDTLEVFRNVRISEERRKVIESINEQAILGMKRYQNELKSQGLEEYRRKEIAFNEIFSTIELSIMDNDIDLFFNGLNKMGEAYQMDFQFRTFEEFNDFMTDKETELIL